MASVCHENGTCLRLEPGEHSGLSGSPGEAGALASKVRCSVLTLRGPAYPGNALPSFPPVGLLHHRLEPARLQLCTGPPASPGPAPCSTLLSALQSRCISNVSLRGLDSPLGTYSPRAPPWPPPHPESEVSAYRSRSHLTPSKAGRNGPALASPLPLTGDGPVLLYLPPSEGAQPRHPGTCTQRHPRPPLTDRPPFSGSGSQRHKHFS